MCALVALFLLNSKSSHVGFAAKYEKVRKSNKEDVALITSARSQVSSKQFNKKMNIWKAWGKQNGVLGFIQTSDHGALGALQFLLNLKR
jgi:hypothetical protein